VSLYASTSDFYRRFRSRVPAELVELLDQRAPHGFPRRLLDVGTGTGFALEALLASFDEAIGVDPDADLLAAAREDPTGDSKSVPFIKAPTETFTLAPGRRAHPVTVCRAFHCSTANASLRTSPTT
jgi:predicted TPR repeat methyltransferase